MTYLVQLPRHVLTCYAIMTASPASPLDWW
jgi:hypothetical protein